MTQTARGSAWFVALASTFCIPRFSNPGSLLLVEILEAPKTTQEVSRYALLTAKSSVVDEAHGNFILAIALPRMRRLQPGRCIIGPIVGKRPMLFERHASLDFALLEDDLISSSRLVYL